MLGAAAAGLLVVAGLRRLYFRQVAEAAEHRPAALTGDDRTRLARDAYTFLHLPLVAGIVVSALGMKTVLHQIADTGHYDLSEPLHGIVAWALPGGAGIFLLASAAILLRTTGRRSVVLLVGGLVCVSAGPLTAVIPAGLRPGAAGGRRHGAGGAVRPQGQDGDDRLRPAGTARDRRPHATDDRTRLPTEGRRVRIRE